MTRIAAKVSGGSTKDFSGSQFKTVKDVREAMNLDTSYKASVHGEPQDDDYELQDDDYVIFAPAVKGGRA